MVVTYDLYKELELERSWDESSIKTRLKEIQRMWTKRQSACNDKDELLIIDELLKKVEEGFRYLIKVVRRKEYDEALDKAYKDGKIKDNIEEKMQSLLDQARQYYRKGNIKLASNCAQEAIDGKINDVEAYDILARCHYDMQNYDKALQVVDQGTEVFPKDINLLWLGARIATVGTLDFGDAQSRVNKLIEVAPDSGLGQSEQVHLYMYKGEEDLAFQEIDTYIEKHPDDNEFKKNIAYDLDSFSNSCYYYDEAQNATFIADKESYHRCLKLRKKAVEIYKDEHTKNRLDDAKYYGKKEWDSWNLDSIKSLLFYGIILTFLVWPLGIAMLGVAALVIYFSFRPYWQINKTYVTGKRGGVERFVTVLGDWTARIGGGLVKLMVQVVIAIFRLLMVFFG